MSKLTDRGVKCWTEYWTSTILTVFDRIQWGKNWTCTLLNLLYIHILTDPHSSIRWHFVLAVYYKVKLIHLKEMPELIAFISETVVMLSHLKHCLYMKRILSCSLSSCPSARAIPAVADHAAFSYLHVASVVLITFPPSLKPKEYQNSFADFRLNLFQKLECINTHPVNLQIKGENLSFWPPTVRGSALLCWGGILLAWSGSI